MAKVRCLQSFYLIKQDSVLNFNDELEIKDEKIVKLLTDQGLVDVLIEPEPKKVKAPKTNKKEAPEKIGEK